MTHKKSRKLAVIFDMNGVIVDDELYHVLAWIAFAKKHGLVLSHKSILKHFLGKPSQKNVLHIIKQSLSPKQVISLVEEKEKIYRKIYGSKIKPVKGLLNFLVKLKAKGVKMAIATSAVPKNVNFVLKATGIKKYFKKIVDLSHVKHSKPHPEIYLRAAAQLKVQAKHCVVFEDSLLGIRSGRSAGMKVIGVATTLKPSMLKHTDLVIKNFSQLSIATLEKLIA